MQQNDLTPPSVQDGEFGYVQGTDGDIMPQSESTDVLSAARASQLARDSYTSSTDWLNASRRRAWRDSLRAFQSIHPEGSKYFSNEYSYRTNLFIPKTRSTVRSDEAATASAFFSNEDVVSIDPEMQDDINQAANAELIKAILQHRLTKTIPWFMTVIGAAQDADVMGVCIAKVYWRYSQRVTGVDVSLVSDALTGELVPSTSYNMETVEDRPCIDLLPPENIRIDPAADWRDPINSSPYVIELIPMTYGEIRLMIDNGKWNDVSDGEIVGSTDLTDDATRNAREQNRIPAKNTNTGIIRPNEFRICWIRATIMRYKGRDWFYYTTGGSCIPLTDPVPLDEVFIGGRPYVMGTRTIEAHKTFPSGKVELLSDLQRGINDQANLRFDNVKMTLNPRQILREGSGIDPNDVRTFMPGKAFFTQDPTRDVVWDRPPDVTASAYQEQNALFGQFDDLAGDQTIQGLQPQVQQQSATGMHLLSGVAAGMSEYELRVFTETFVEPVLRKLIILEQAYENDETILAVAASNAKLFVRFGISQVTDDLLRSSVTTKVNVGVGATNTAFRLKRLNEAADTMGKMFGQSVALGLNFGEVCKEVFGACGFDDGARFFKPGFDPAQAMMEQQQQAQQHQQPQQNNPALQVAAIRSQTSARTDQLRAQTALAKIQSQERTALIKAQSAAQAQEAETHRVLLQHGHELHVNRMQAHIDAANGFLSAINNGGV